MKEVSSSKEIRVKEQDTLPQAPTKLAAANPKDAFLAEKCDTDTRVESTVSMRGGRRSEPMELYAPYLYEDGCPCPWCACDCVGCMFSRWPHSYLHAVISDQIR